jgi:transposase
VFVIKTFYCTGGSCVDVERQYCREIYVRVALSRAMIYRIVKQSEETGSVFDKCARGHKHGLSIHTEEIVSSAREAVATNPNGFKPLRLLVVLVLEEDGVSEKSTYNSGTENNHLIRD